MWGVCVTKVLHQTKPYTEYQPQAGLPILVCFLVYCSTRQTHLKETHIKWNTKRKTWNIQYSNICWWTSLYFVKSESHIFLCFTWCIRISSVVFAEKWQEVICMLSHVICCLHTQARDTALKGKKMFHSLDKS